MKNKPHVHPSEQPDGDYACDLKKGDTRLETQVRTKIADDGVEETHITYIPFGRGIKVQGFGPNYDKIDWDE